MISDPERKDVDARVDWYGFITSHGRLGQVGAESGTIFVLNGTRRTNAENDVRQSKQANRSVFE